jgi:hypothetical protein
VRLCVSLQTKNIPFRNKLNFQNYNLSIEETEKHNTKNEGKKKKNALIDKFIENSPRYLQLDISPTVRIDISRDDHSSLMTETLAKVYLEQKKNIKSDSNMRY